ncbi:MAG: transposase [Candidatus Aenigmarchaeota archaeon]|nr:transposase [Candidatus Aenigmarchaeota archaeon]
MIGIDKTRKVFKVYHTAQMLSEGFNTWYNLIRPHQALNGMTPSQVARIDLNLDRNQWLSLLRQSLENKV